MKPDSLEPRQKMQDILALCPEVEEVKVLFFITRIVKRVAVVGANRPLLAMRPVWCSVKTATCKPAARL